MTKLWAGISAADMVERVAPWGKMPVPKGVTVEVERGS
jgi:hypothetical protein